MLSNSGHGPALAFELQGTAMCMPLAENCMEPPLAGRQAAAGLASDQTSSSTSCINCVHCATCGPVLAPVHMASGHDCVRNAALDGHAAAPASAQTKLCARTQASTTPVCVVATLLALAADMGLDCKQNEPCQKHSPTVHQSDKRTCQSH